MTSAGALAERCPPAPIKYPYGRVDVPTVAAVPRGDEAAGANRLLLGAYWILVAALIRTTVLVCLLVLFFAGHKTQPFQLDIHVARTPPAPHASPSAPHLMERRAPAAP